MTTTAPEQTVTKADAVTGSTTTFVTTAVIPVGRVIVIGTGRSATASDINGLTGISTSAGAVSGFRKLGVACRSGTHDMALAAVEVTTQIPSGSTITATHADSGGKRGGVMTVLPNVTLPPVEDTTSGLAADGGAGNVSAGPNGSGTTGTATASSSMPAGDHVAIGLFSHGGTVDTTEGAGYALVAKVKTASGSGDRGCLMEYANVSSAGVKSATVTYASSSGWAGVIATLPLSSGVTPPVTSVIVGGVKKPVSTRSVIVGGVKKTVTSRSVIIGGVKKATV